MQDERVGLSFEDAFAPGEIRYGWTAFQRFWPVLYVGGCVKSCTEGGSGGGGGGGDDERQSALREGGDWLASLDVWAQDGAAGEVPQWLVGRLGELVGAIGLATLIAATIAFLFLWLAFRAWLLPGWIKLHREIVEEGRGTFGTLLSGGSHFLPMLGYILLETCVFVGLAAITLGLVFAIDKVGPFDAAVAGGLLFGVPAFIYVALGMALSGHHVVLDDLGPMDALTRSWDGVEGRRLALGVFLIGCVLVRALTTVVGLCFFCVGALFTAPVGVAIADVAFTRAFLRFRRPTRVSAAWPVG